MKFYIKIKENTGTEEEAESYLYSSEGTIITFSDKEKAAKRAQSLARFLNGNKKTKKNGALVIPIEAKKAWQVKPTFNQ
jgi:hypothetical protein